MRVADIHHRGRGTERRSSLQDGDISGSRPFAQHVAEFGVDAVRRVAPHLDQSLPDVRGARGATDHGKRENRSVDDRC